MTDVPRTGAEAALATFPEPVQSLLTPAVTAATLESATIRAVAGRLAEIVAAGGLVYAFGAGHAAAFAAELYSRAGGLREFVAMSLEDLRTGPRPARLQYADSGPEREPRNGPALLDLYRVGRQDALLIASQSGRNGASIEMALRARRQGTYTVAVVSRAHCLAAASRHPSGLRLVDCADVVIDNHCPVGDATLTLMPGSRACATSTLSFALIAQLINAEVIRSLAERGHTPEVIRSANLGE